MTIIDKIQKKTGQSVTPDVTDILSIMSKFINQDAQDASNLQKIKKKYEKLATEQKISLFREMILQFEVPKPSIEPVMKEILDREESDPLYGRLISDLRKACRAPRWNIFREFVNVEGGLKFILDFRSDLLASQRELGIDLTPLDSDLIFMLNTLFQHGFLVLQEITLDSSYRQLKLIANHDLVHPMANLEEMADRLGKDRLCFALYHRLMPNEPVIFIEVALTKSIAHSITEIIQGEKAGEKRNGETDTAMFYSINNAQQGLTGMGLGKVLIGKVVEHIKQAKPNIKNFSTLSPLPGFWNRYLKPVLKGEKRKVSLTREEINSFFPKKSQEAMLKEFAGEGQDLCAVLLEQLSDPAWPGNESFRELVRKPLTDIAFHYVAKEKNERGNPINPVANFHMSNGARVNPKSINFLGNPSPRGLEESCGVMVNYVYSLHWMNQIKQSFRWINI